MKRNELTLAELEALAREEKVTGKTVGCLVALQSDDEEIRTWATEVLSGPAEPSTEEEAEIASVMQSTFTNGAASQSWSAVEADQLYWCATMLGRMDAISESSRESLQMLAECSADDLQGASRRAKSVLGRMA
ncbi:hypothetical protein [Rhodopirellula halodulae]|uniref:hypothetical protein n=1 Tax=Rhodopirellula halodulae TaxID=2894198 RepID=UPI001E4F284A|nr:hypothetical protein [Rhodopirellula sp. JC737]MCC9655967.1 hypothetical protein [Rhodopirellula sp. JC737]